MLSDSHVKSLGPIIPLISYSSIADAIAQANSTPYGLGATVWSDDATNAKNVASQIDAGTVYINNYIVPDWRGYMTGHKQSGIGGSGGKDWLKESCEVRVIHEYKAKAKM